MVADRDESSLGMFAAGLRRLREDAGLSFRAMSRKVHFSHTALAAAASGKALPSLEVTLAFVDACGGDQVEWQQRWRAVHADLDEERWSPSLAVSPFPPPLVQDGVDPDDAQCTADAVTIEAAKVSLPGKRHFLGQVELRYSPGRHAAWGRFLGYKGLDALAMHRHDVVVAVSVAREDDGRAEEFVDGYAFDYMWCDLVTTGRGVFHASVRLVFDGEEAATGRTRSHPLP